MRCRIVSAQSVIMKRRVGTLMFKRSRYLADSWYHLNIRWASVTCGLKALFKYQKFPCSSSGIWLPTLCLEDLDGSGNLALDCTITADNVAWMESWYGGGYCCHAYYKLFCTTCPILQPLSIRLLSSWPQLWCSMITPKAWGRGSSPPPRCNNVRVIREQ